MSTSFILVLKKKNIFNSTINNLIIFQNIQDAYEYGLTLELSIARNIVNTLDTVKSNNILWTSKKDVYPYVVCKIYPILNDVLWNIYQNVQLPNPNTELRESKRIARYESRYCSTEPIESISNSPPRRRTALMRASSSRVENGFVT